MLFRSEVMNDKLKAFIASLAVVILCAVVAIITFSQGVWYGAIPLALGIFFLIRFTIPAWNEYQEIYGKSDSCKILISRCETLIKEYSHSEGCVGEILPKIKRDAPKDIKIDDIEKQSRFFLMNYCANLLSTGQYHFYTDSLDPMGRYILYVFEGCSKWLLDNKHLSQEEYDNCNKELRQNLKEVG